MIDPDIKMFTHCFSYSSFYFILISFKRNYIVLRYLLCLWAVNHVCMLKIWRCVFLKTSTSSKTMKPERSSFTWFSKKRCDSKIPKSGISSFFGRHKTNIWDKTNECAFHLKKWKMSFEKDHVQIQKQSLVIVFS